jgi:hypothetical protein
MAGIVFLIQELAMFARTLTVVSLVVALAGGCRDSGGDDDDDTGADGGADDVSIYAIQDGTIATGAIVNIRGVVVTAIDSYGADRSTVFVQEPNEDATHGRAYSGLQIYVTDLGAVSGIAVGDTVDVEGGAVTEFRFGCEDPEVDCTDTLQTVTQITGSYTITKTGTGTVPDPVTVLPQDLAADANEAEKWEGVLIKFDNVAVTSGLRDIDPEDDPTFKEMRVTGPFRVQSALADLGAVTRDDCYTSVTGIGSFFFQYFLLPRSANDLAKAADGTGCLYEIEAAECGDGNDNDFDGFADCADFSCQDANPALCTEDGTVVEIQDGTHPINTRVALTGVVVTAIASNSEDLWVQDAGSTADYNGVHVYRGTGASALTLAVGDVIDVTGTINEYFEETQLVVDPKVADVSNPTGTDTPAVVTGLSVSTLNDAVDGEPYEGMLTELSNVKTVVLDDTFGGFTVGIDGDDLTVDNELFDFTLPTSETCYATIRGVMAYSFDRRRLYPRSAADVVTGGTCP